MAHNRTTRYSAPYRRNNLLGLHQYVASDNFPSLGFWDRAKSEDLYVVRGTLGRTHPVLITVVGAITSDKTSLLPHGNYNPSYVDPEDLPKKAKLQFYIACPSDDPDFTADYQLGLKRLKAIQDEVAASKGRKEHFIIGQSMKMNFLLFEEKKSEEEAPIHVKKENVKSASAADDQDEVPPPTPVSPPYEVAAPYRSLWDAVSETHHNCIMEAFGVDELPVDYRRFHKVLVSGTTVIVTFILKHYSIRDKTTSQPVSDTYTALVRSVSVLKEIEKVPRSPFPPKRRPVPVSQLPSRATLKLAADAFSPIRLPEYPVSSTEPFAGVSRRREISPLALDAVAQQSTLSDFTVSGGAPTTTSNGSGGESSRSSERAMSVLLPLFLKELKSPASKMLSSELFTILERSASPAVSSSSTGSTLSDTTRANEDNDASSWEDVNRPSEARSDGLGKGAASSSVAAAASLPAEQETGDVGVAPSVQAPAADADEARNVSPVGQSTPANDPATGLQGHVQDVDLSTPSTSSDKSDKRVGKKRKV